MKPKTIVILGVVLAVMAGLVFIRQQQDQPVSILDQVSLKAMVPGGVTADSVGKLEIYAGARTDEKVVLVREGDGWRAASHFNAPVQAGKVTDFLDDVLGLEGEFRASTVSDDDRATYDLTEEAGFHVAGYPRDSDTPLFHVVVGKAPRFDAVFARTAGDTDVYIVDVNLRQQAGLFTDDRETPPKADPWLDKQLASLDSTAIARMELTYPDKVLVLERREAPREEPEAEEEGEDDGAPVIQPVEYEWVAVEGGVEHTPKESGLTQLRNKLANLSGTDIVDPTDPGEWHLDDPGYTLRVTLDGSEEPVVIEAGRDPESDNGYLRLAGDERKMIYQVNRYGFEQLFPKANALFDLPAMAVSSADINRIEYMMDGAEVVLEKADDAWRVTQPSADLPTVSSKVQGIAAGLAGWRAEDYADGGRVDAGLTNPERRVTFTTVLGETHTIELGAKSRHIDAYYTRYNGGGQILTTSRLDANKIFVEPRELYQRSLLDVDEYDVEAITVTREDGGESYTLKRAEGGWMLTAGDETVEALEHEADDLAFALADLEGADLIFGEMRIMGGILASVELVMNDGTQHRLNIEIARDGQHPVTVTGKGNVAFLVPAADMDEILRPADAYRIAAAEVDEDAAGDEAEEGDDDSPEDGDEAQ